MIVALILCGLIIAVVTVAVALDAGPTEYEPEYHPHAPFDPTVDLTMIRLLPEPPYDWDTAREPDWDDDV